MPSELDAEMKDLSEENSDERVGLGCMLECFQHYPEISDIISCLEDTYTNVIASEKVYERLKYLVDLYQEQPHLLDPFLDRILSSLLMFVRRLDVEKSLRDLSCKILYLFTKTRGAKVIVRHMPHEIGDLQLILCLLDQQDPSDKQSWETRYMLLIWLSFVVIIPIHLERLDGEKVGLSTLERIFGIIQTYLSTDDLTGTAAPILAGRFLTRPDAKISLPHFIDWSIKVILEKEFPKQRQKEGVLASLAQLFKHGKREDMNTYGSEVLQKLLDSGCTEDSNTNLRKNAFKLIQRIGLTFMRVKIADWRYSRGSRSLALNLSSKDNEVKDEDKNVSESGEDDGYEIPDEIEEIIEQLFKGLKDEAEIPRWSAAKGLGRIAERLPKELADDVISTLLDMFHMREGDKAWHGGCLALAELARRGLLLPSHLNSVVPVLTKALVYDEMKGNFSTGSNIRDAACYVCWAFARAYDTQVLKPYILDLAQSLIITAIFDRQVSCRRAASAAFQENVGRQGTFPYGIEILTTVDYFTVSQLVHCYLELSVFVSQFSGYAKPLIDHLVEHKVNHYDIRVRTLTSQALNKLTPGNESYMVETILPILVPLATGFDVSGRHGSILAIGEILEALSQIRDEKSMQKYIGYEMFVGIRAIPCALQEKKMFRGLCAEMFRSSISMFMQKILRSSMLSSDDWQTLDFWRDLQYEFLGNTNATLRSQAALALSTMFTVYYSDQKEKCQDCVKNCMINLFSHQEEVRSGYITLIGRLPIFILENNHSEIIEKLLDCIKVLKKEEETWVESRQCSIKSIILVLKTLGLNCILNATISEIFEHFLIATGDYTSDSRGDIGFVVRRASLEGLRDLTLLVLPHNPSLLGPDFVSRMFCKIMQLAVEVQDRVRESAALVLLSLLKSSPAVPHVPHIEKLKEVFKEEDCKGVIWIHQKEAYPFFLSLMNLPTYTYPLLLGFSVSIGSKTTYLIKYTSSCLLSYLTSIRSEQDKLTAIEETFLRLFHDHSEDNRIVINLLVMADFLINSGVFEETDSNKFPFELYNACWNVAGRSKTALRVLPLIDVLSGLISFEGRCRQKALSSLSILMCQQYPRIRRAAAQKLCEAVVTIGDCVSEDNLEELMNILTETDWGSNKSKESFKPIRNKVCHLLGLAPPQVMEKN